MQFYIAVGAIPVSYIIYSISRPSQDGEKGWVGNLIQKYANLSEEWETRNALRTAAIEQAAHDKHLLYNAPRNRHIDLKFPEYVPPTHISGGTRGKEEVNQNRKS